MKFTLQFFKFYELGASYTRRELISKLDDMVLSEGKIMKGVDVFGKCITGF